MMTELDASPELITATVAELAPGTADLDEGRARFQLYLLGIGRYADDSVSSYRRADAPAVWMHAGWPYGTWLSWDRHHGTRFLLHRARGGEKPWPPDAVMWSLAA